VQVASGTYVSEYQGLTRVRSPLSGRGKDPNCLVVVRGEPNEFARHTHSVTSCGRAESFNHTICFGPDYRKQGFNCTHPNGACASGNVTPGSLHSH